MYIAAITPHSYCHFWSQQAAVFGEDNPTVHCLLTSKQQRDTITDWLVNIVKHSAAKELDIFLRGRWRTKLELKESGQVVRNTTPPEW